MPSWKARWVYRVRTDRASAHGRIRTCDTWLRRPVLYPLSYVGEESYEAAIGRCRGPGRRPVIIPGFPLCWRL